MPQHDLSNTDVPVLGLGTHSCQEISADHVTYDVHNTGRNKLLDVLFLKHDVEVHDYFREIHKRGVWAHNSGPFICKPTQSYPFSRADCHLLITRPVTS